MSRLHRRRIITKENAQYHYDQTKGLKAYREEYTKKKGNDSPKKDANGIAGYSTAIKHPRHGLPWYYLSKRDRIAIEHNRPSTRMTRDAYVEGYLNYKLTKWKALHPEPQENDLFYKEEHPRWVTAYEAKHDEIMSFLSKKYIKKFTRTLINTVMTSKSKHSIAA